MLRQDIRAAVRSVWRARTLTAVLLLSLGLGTGANAAVYSVIDALLFRAPEGIADPRRLASVFTSQYDGSPFGSSSMPDYRSIAESVRSLEAIAAFDDRTTTNARIGDHLQMTRIATVTGNFFRVLGLPSHQGRLLDERDYTPAPTAVISFALWEAAGRPQLESLMVTVLGHDRAVVGVGPPRFRGLDTTRPIDVWVPLRNEFMERGRGDRHLTLIGRLRDRVAFEKVDTELKALSERLAIEFPSTNRGVHGQPEQPRQITIRPYSPLRPEARAQASLIAAIVAGAVGMLLLSACMNAGNLLLSRGFARRRELAVKMALGATRVQLVRQLMTESLLVSIGGAALGLAFAGWTMKVIPALFSPDHAAMLDTTLRPAVILTAIAIAAAAGALFGIAPAFHATSSPAVTALRADAGGVSDQQGGRRLRATLVTAQIALSTVLLLGAGLLVTSLRGVLQADTSFPAENVAVVAMVNPGKFEDPLRGLSFERTLVDKLLKTAGVHTIGWATAAPLAAATRDEFRIAAGAADVTDAVELDVNVVSLTYFEAIGLQRLEGRLFGSGDQALTKPVVVIDELLARRYFGVAAVGQHLVDADGERYEIVGVVRGRRFRTLQEAPRPTVYFPVAQRYVPQGNLFVVTRGDATSLVNALPRIIASIDNGAKITRVMRLDHHLSEALAIDRLTTTLVSVCGALALVMAVIGVYGVMNDAVQRRTREIGLRVALGAARTQVAKLVFTEAVYVSAAGLAAGTVFALAAGGIVGQFISGLPAWQLTTLGGPPAVLALIVAVAAILPLRRALSVSAAIALRAE